MPIYSLKAENLKEAQEFIDWMHNQHPSCEYVFYGNTMTFKFPDYPEEYVSTIFRLFFRRNDPILMTNL